MPLKLSKTPTSDFTEYNRFYKKLYGIILIVIVSLIALTAVLYLIFLRKLNPFEDTFIPLILNHIKFHIFGYTSLGLFYACLFGGLFFLLVPVELIFVASLSSGSMTPAHIALMFVGLITSYSINYLIGLRFSRFSKNMISPKQFYRTKLAVNKYGKAAIVFFNLIGAGSQQLTFVLGVLRYNKTRLFIFSLIGQILKYSFITASILGIF